MAKKKGGVNNPTTTAAAEPKSGNVFEKHIKDDKVESRGGLGQMSWRARIVLFIVFPVMAGCMGMCAAHLEHRRKPEREIDFDSDFMMPFLLGLVFVIVVGFQTRGYTTDKVEPIVKWPKVRRKKVVRTVKENGEGDEDEGEAEKDTTNKKDD